MIFRMTCDACPTQAEGRTSDGRAFYFRYRSGRWTLRVSRPGGDVWQAVKGEIIAEGERGDGLGGWMDEDDVRAIVSEHLT